ncbi:hypothetical protein F5B21DRAFT_147321 [Xylaria acuta]|nr:hypothetical protein F5B21DRAFT_147321 [Xylaria acuta]
MLRPARGLSDSSSAHVVLFTTGADITPKTIIGGYFPASSEKSAHILFQLRPTLRRLRWIKAKVWLVDLIKTEGKLPTDETVASEVSNSPYWIGGPMGLNVGLRIDPEKRTATLAKGAGGCYTDVVLGRKDSTGKSWEVMI